MANMPRSKKDEMIAQMWPDLAAYEKGPQTKVSDKVNPFRGATPARAADAAAVAAVAAGNVDATPGGAPVQAVADSDSLTDDAPIVDEDGTLGDPTDSGEGTSDETSDSSTDLVDPSDESDPNADLTGEVETDPAPKKGSAAERIVELNDLTEGYKLYGKAKEEEVERLKAELAAARPQSQAPAAPAFVEEKDEPMPDMADEDVAFDNDKFRSKMSNWVKTQGRIEARRELRAAAEAQANRSISASLETKVEAFEKEHPDFKQKVRENKQLAAHQLHPFAGRKVMKSEYTADLLYQFGNDLPLAIRTARMDPEDQVSVIDDMIAKIKAKKANVKNNPTDTGAKPGAKKSITQAPPPPRATPAGGRPTAKNVLDPSMGMDEFARQHRQGKQSARVESRKGRGLA